jgi:hypothetical protein
MQSLWRKDVRKMEAHERAFVYGILFVVFFAFFMTTSLVKAYANYYSFTPKEYQRLVQDTCLMGEKLVDSRGEGFRGFRMLGPKLVDEKRGTLGQLEAYFLVNRAGNRAELYILSVIVTKEKPIVTKVFLIDSDLDGKPDLQGESKAKLGEVTDDGKEFWNVWIVRFIERNNYNEGIHQR